MPKAKTQKHIADVWTAAQIAAVPHCMEMAEAFYRDKAEFGESWPSWCGLPMAAVYAILTGGADTDAARAVMQSIGIERLPELTAALNWIQAKAVYRFDPDLAEAMLEQPLDNKIPPESLFTLPQHCVYIETPIPCYSRTALGVFAWLELDAHNHTPELRLQYLLSSEETMSMTVMLTGGTIEDYVIH